jgi:hypothetical protein
MSMVTVSFWLFVLGIVSCIREEQLFNLKCNTAQKAF